ncbi:knob-associated histidine-rich protein-like [Stylophora pistillata]|uniref:Uncharacterized protein n=1 Tax=Stylophora pistillata TaxID=50429 RepID=A0A2B4SVK6_STYPI|nr:knob-associated histidine-rich protein-like [Stylophora pistillata]XP_022804155.1 knob-associated histidine-rich protein-like [Stylophora pistillata]PFX33219.1 hypothetical protein AWC38_SpisGene1860 [Stylophora pistillata]
MNVAFLLFSVLLALIFNVCDGAVKGARANGVEHKTKLHRKIFHHPHHHHHHHYHHHHHPHRRRHHLGHHRHLLHYHHHHPHHHHDNRPRYHHRHHRHHHHHHNPLHHHLHHHNHFHKHPLHHYHYKNPFHSRRVLDKHHQRHRRSDILHVSGVLPNKLKLHVQVKGMQATKRQSLPNLLANLGQHLMNLGSSLSPRKSQMEIPSPLNETRNDKVGKEISETPVTEGDQNFVKDSSSTPAAALEDSQTNNMSVTNVEDLLHNALDAGSSDHSWERGFSGNGEANALDATSTKDLNSDEAKKGDRRNETYSEPEIYGPVENQEHDISNDTVEDSAEEQIHEIEDKRNKYQLKDRQATTKGEDKPLVQGANPKNAASKKDILTDDENTLSLRQKEKTLENGTENASLRLAGGSLPKEPKNLESNSTLDENERPVVDVAPESSVTLIHSNQSAIPSESDSQQIKEEKEENIETSGSGEDSLDDARNNKDAIENDDRVFEEGSESGEEPTKDNIFDVSERKTSVKDTAKQSDFRESKEGFKEPSDQPAVVSVAGNQTMGNQSEEAFYPDFTESIQPKNESPVLEDSKSSGQPFIGNDAEKATFSVDSAIKDATIHDSNPRESLDESKASQSTFNETGRVISDTKLEKSFHTNSDQPITNLDFNEAQPNEQGQPTLSGIDNESRTASITQGSPEETGQTQAMNSQNDQNGVSVGPKTPVAVDGPAEPPLSNIAYPTVVNVDQSQVNDYHEDASQDVSSEDNSDEIPVYTLSSPVSNDSLAEDETTLSSMPASSVNAASADFIDSGANMSPGYSESSQLSEEYDTFPATTAPSEFVNSTLSEEGGFQRDMLDDPVQESLETVADSKPS